MKEGNTDKKGMYVVDRYEVMREEIWKMEY